MRKSLELAATGLELGRALLVLPRVELARRRLGPKPLLERFRARGRRARKRDSAGRARLRRAIGWLDARLPGEPNCYRRALLEIALDRGAAAEPFRMGLRAGGGSRSGHAWLGSEQDGEARYDVEITL